MNQLQMTTLSKTIRKTFFGKPDMTPRKKKKIKKRKTLLYTYLQNYGKSN